MHQKSEFLSARTITLLQYLLSRGVVVSQGVACIAILVKDVRVGDLVLQTPGRTYMRLWWIKSCSCGCADNFCPESLQDMHLGHRRGWDFNTFLTLKRRNRATYLLHAHLLRHHNDAMVAFYCSYEGEANTCTKSKIYLNDLFPSLYSYNTAVSSFAQTDVPVFPEVGSMMVSPGLRTPALSASSTMRRAILSFTLPPALKNSHLATKHSHPLKTKKDILHQGVFKVNPKGLH